MTDDIFALVGEAPAAQALRRRVEQGGVLSVAGVAGAARPFLAALLSRWFPDRPVLLVVDTLKTQEALQQDLETWLGARATTAAPGSANDGDPPAARRPGVPLFHPAWEVLPHETRLPHADVVSERLDTLVRLVRAPSEDAAWPVINTTATALMQRTFAPGYLRGHLREIRPGDRLNPLDLIEWLEDQGYESELRVSRKGELALRGGILDVFPLNSPWPVRLEFFGDEVESLRHFDPATQVSRAAIPGVTLPPAGELGLLRALSRQPAEIPSDHGKGACPPACAVLGTLLDYLPSNTVVLLCEPSQLETQAESYLGQVENGEPLVLPWASIRHQLLQAALTVLEVHEADKPAGTAGPFTSTVSIASEGASESEPVGSECEPAPASAPGGGGNARPTGLGGGSSISEAPGALAAGARPAFRELAFTSLEVFRPALPQAPEAEVLQWQRREFFAQIHRWLRRAFAVSVFFNNQGEQQRFEELWAEYGLDDAATPRPVLRQGTLSRGFLCEEARVVVVTDAEIFGRYKVQRPRRLRSPHAAALRSSLDIDFSELEEGDLVVHLQHGIGRYLGLMAMPGGARDAEGPGEECLAIEYAPREPDQPAPRLYVPVSEAHLVSKYVGAGKARPPLNTLGSGRWLRTRVRAEQAVRDVAAELLAIQAARETQPGQPCGPDTPWQREFESAFLYEETPDQLRAIQETKADMERARPMDRLICGDVGFGKTEVAIRAAFKAVMSGRQVAVLVPTTVLAQQHYNVLRERMADYPVRIELLSRFRKPASQRAVIQGLADGSVDIVVGTHRLLQRDVRFKELGLVVIDEEQRFGVLQKERFKQLRRLVDVLTLSATPIPRTLYLALAGARDMSTIQTPPQDRLPVETIVSPYDERLIREAILRELRRGGQVFFLHNRVMTIHLMADKLRALVPDARLVVGHGQMEADELEEVMTRFVNGEADVLLSTTIIESGLDIPNANTIIIDRADRFGLSDLYQLRGRVGRYKHQAYAYLLIPRHARLLTDARKRISALKQYSTLGSGFKIAMRDLEIRGAGNLLGPEQSGHITAVGFDLYCQLLKRSVARLRGEPFREPLQVALRLDFLSARDAAESGSVGTKPSRLTTRRRARGSGDLDINVPRDSWAYAGDESAPEPADSLSPAPRKPAAACLPMDYIPDPVQRIEVYRKLALAAGPGDLEALRVELRDRFGPLPEAAELALAAAEIKLLAAERGITTVESRGDRLMLSRGNEYIMAGGRFPRLTGRTARARLREIRRLLRSVAPQDTQAVGRPTAPRKE